MNTAIIITSIIVDLYLLVHIFERLISFFAVFTEIRQDGEPNDEKSEPIAAKSGTVAPQNQSLDEKMEEVPLSEAGSLIGEDIETVKIVR